MCVRGIEYTRSSQLRLLYGMTWRIFKSKLHYKSEEIPPSVTIENFFYFWGMVNHTTTHLTTLYIHHVQVHFATSSELYPLNEYLKTI